jgi:hypothetical protein
MTDHARNDRRCASPDHAAKPLGNPCIPISAAGTRASAVMADALDSRHFPNAAFFTTMRP